MSVRIDRDGPVIIMTIDRPAKRNAVDPATAAALRDAFASFADEADARVAVLTGSEGHFCAGFDLGAVGTSRYDPDGPGPMGPTRMLLEKPVIAAVAGSTALRFAGRSIVTMVTGPSRSIRTDMPFLLAGDGSIIWRASMMRGRRAKG